MDGAPSYAGGTLDASRSSSQAEILVRLFATRQTAIRVLSVPADREGAVVGRDPRAADPSFCARASFFGIDLDPSPLELSRKLAGGLPGFRFFRADALDAAAYPQEMDVILSTGLGEFLSDEQLVSFYAVCGAALCKGGSLVTSGPRDPVSDS